jgi:hypothetical protein
MANSGCFQEAQATEELFIRNFSALDHIVTPSGSCTHHLRNKFTAAPDSPERRKVSASVYDLVEFLHDVLRVREFPWAEFNHKVAFHTSCSAIHDAYDHPHFQDKAYSLLMSGPSGPADIGGITVHPAQGVMTLTVIFWPRTRTERRKQS